MYDNGFCGVENNLIAYVSVRVRASDLTNLPNVNGVPA